MYYIGIDIGLSGAIGVLDGKGEFVGVHDMPTMANFGGMKKVKNQVNASRLATILLSYGYAKAVIVEDVGSRPGEGVASVFSFGDSYGQIKGMLGVMQCPYQLVKPNIWKPALGLTKQKGETKQQNKERARAEAIRCWPTAPLELKKHEGRAEALLLAKYLLLTATQGYTPVLSRNRPRSKKTEPNPIQPHSSVTA